MAESGFGVRGGLDGDGGAPEWGPSFEVDEVREAASVVSRRGEGYDTGGRTRRGD